MGYRADLWIALAAAVPVIGVALAVTLVPFVETGLAVLGRAFAVGVRGFKRWGRLAVVLVYALFFIAQIWGLTRLFYLAMRSLADERNAHDPGSLIFDAVVLFIVVFSYTASGAVFAMIERANRGEFREPFNGPKQDAA